MTRARIAERGVAWEIVARLLSPMLAVRHAFRGVRAYGAATRDTYQTPIWRQFFYLIGDYFWRIRPDDFYLHRLHLPERRRLRGRTFAFSQTLAMQKFLIDRFGSADYPLLKSKAKFAAKCAAEGLPTIPVIAEFTAGISRPPRPDIPDADLISKPSDLMLGLGTMLWRRAAPMTFIDDAGIGDTGAGPLSADALVARLRADSASPPPHGGSGDILLQARKFNHPSMIGTLTAGGLSTIRVVTCRAPPRGIELLPAVIRMPVGDAIADNIAQGGLAAPIDMASGRICGPAVRKDKRVGLVTHKVHPSTGTVLDGFRIPFWAETVALARRAHLCFLSLHAIGWDIAILPDGPILLEGNAWWDTDLTVLPHQITLSDTSYVSTYVSFLETLGMAGTAR